MNKSAELPPEVQRAVWAGDHDELDRILGCICCCDEHTFDGCPARLWEGCRGSGTLSYADIRDWARHYGMTLSEFYGIDDPA